jgi:cob(I)alamin adenosyltransferase
MQYGSEVSRQGSERPFRSYHASSVRRNIRRAFGAGTAFAAGFLRILAAMKIYTRTGDKGDTGLLGGTRVQKSDPRVAAYGDVDELNACLGVARAQPGIDADVREMLAHIQKDLFAIGAQLADPAEKISARVAKAAVGDADVERLEHWIDALEADLPPLRRFILPGGSAGGSLLHLARTVCRRAERAIVGLGGGKVDPRLVIYINRLSDLLFVLARAVNHRTGQAETEW